MAKRNGEDIALALGVDVKLIKRTHRRMPLTTRQGLLLLLALGIFFALVFTIVYSLPNWSE